MRFEVAYALVSIEGGLERVHGDFTPRLRDVRRVPARYQQILPLPVMKRHQCVVLGASSHMLTIGFVERENKRLLDFLQVLTGAKIFPVLVEPARMRLIIARMERSQRFQRRYSQSYYVLSLPTEVRLLLRFQERGEGEG
jgi:hypothetical protein